MNLLVMNNNETLVYSWKKLRPVWIIIKQNDKFG